MSGNNPNRSQHQRNPLEEVHLALEREQEASVARARSQQLLQSQNQLSSAMMSAHSSSQTNGQQQQQQRQQQEQMLLNLLASKHKQQEMPRNRLLLLGDHQNLQQQPQHQLFSAVASLLSQETTQQGAASRNDITTRFNANSSLSLGGNSMQQQQRLLQNGAYGSAGYVAADPSAHLATNKMGNVESQLSFLSNDASRKAPISLVSCRARGMPPDHNAKVSSTAWRCCSYSRSVPSADCYSQYHNLQLRQTAYFIIPSGIKHGDGLQCSHALCKKKGIRFVYCTFCGIPVARVNFSTRHRHDQLKKQEKSTKTSSSPGLVGEGSSKASLLSSLRYAAEDEEGARPFKSRRLGDCSSALSFPQSHLVNQSLQNRASLSQTGINQTDLTSKVEGSRISLSADDSSASEMKTTRTQDRWLSLMSERPPGSDTAAFKSWLISLIKVSEPFARNNSSESFFQTETNSEDEKAATTTDAASIVDEVYQTVFAPDSHP